MIRFMALYPPHDKNFGPFPARTVKELTDEVVDILTTGADGTDTERRRASDLLRNFTVETPVWSPNNAHELAGLLGACFQSLQNARSPFESYLEAPEAIIELYQTHGPGLRDAAGVLTAQILLLLRDVAERLVETTPWATLIKMGFGGSDDA